MSAFPSVQRAVCVLVVVLAFSASTLAQSGSPTFSAPTMIDIGGVHSSIAAGDLNGDGALDLVATNPAGLSMLSGDGHGGFAPPISHALAGGPSAVALADFDGDRNLDIVVALSDTGDVAILRGTGGGSFAAPNNIHVGQSLRTVAAGDFNGDGWPDVWALDHSAARIAVLNGDGTGQFVSAPSVAVNTDTVAIALGDVNGDSTIDLITADATANTISINGAVIATATAGAIATTDVNGDGALDLVIASGAGTSIAILIGDGAGGFAAPANVEIGGAAIAIAAGDVNGDGARDIAATLAQGALAIVLNLTAQDTGSESSESSGGSESSAPSIASAALTVPADVQCHYTWNQPGNGDWNEPLNWTPWGPPPPDSTACIPDADPGGPVRFVFVRVPTTIGTVVLGENRALELFSRLELVDGAYMWGDIDICSRNDGDALVVDPGAVMRLNGTRIVTSNNASPGSFCRADSRVFVPVGATLRNDSGDSFLTGRFDVLGRAEAVSGRLTFQSQGFPLGSQWGAVLFDVAGGATIELAGTEFLGPGSRKIGAGLLDITGVQHGELTIDGPSRLAPSPSPGIVGGTLFGGTTGNNVGKTVVSNIGSIDIVGTNNITFHTLVVNGTATLQLQNSGLCLGSSGTIEVNGTVEIRGTAGFIFNCGGAGFIRVQPGGTFRKHASSTGLVQITQNALLINDGRVEINAGQLKLLESNGQSSGVYNLAPGTVLEQAAGILTLVGGGAIEGEGLARLTGGAALVGFGVRPVENLHVQQGSVGSNVRITKTMTFDAGTISASLQIDPNATLIVPPNPFFKEMPGSLVVFGTAVIDQEFCATGSMFIQGGGVLHFRQGVLGRCGGAGQIIINPDGTLRSDQTSDPARQILWYPMNVFGKVSVTSGKLRIFEGNTWNGGSELEVAGGAIASIETFNSDRVQHFGGFSNARVTGGGTLDVNGMITGRPVFFSTVNLLSSNAVFDGNGQADAWGQFNIFGGRLQNGFVLNVLNDTNLYSNVFNPCGGQVRVSRGALNLRVPGAVMPCGFFGGGSLFVDRFGTLVGDVNAGQQIDLQVQLTNNGTVVTNSGRLSFFGANLSNDDGGTITGGTWIANANTTLGAAGSIHTNAASIILDGSGATFGFFSELTRNTPAGRLTVQNGATLTTSDFTNEGTLTIGAATFTARFGFLQQGGVTSLVHPSAVLTTPFGGVPAVQGGLFEGIGTVKPGLHNAGGIVRPGFGVGFGQTAGVLHVDGDYDETPEGTLKMFMKSAEERSMLDVKGTATFAGTLFLDPWLIFDSIGDPSYLYIPSPGDSHDLVKYGARVGTHGHVENVYLTQDFNYFMKRRYDADTLNVTASKRMTVDDVAISPAEGPAQTIVLASFADEEFGRTDPADYSAFVFWSDIENQPEATVRYDESLHRFIVETTRGFLDNGPVDLQYGVFSNGDDGQGVFNFLTVDVRNLPAVVTPAANRTIDPGIALSLNVASFADPGVLDTHVAEINWGDGTIEPGIVTEVNGAGTVAGSHIYHAVGKYNVIVTITDDDGAPASASFEVTVKLSDTTPPTCTAKASPGTIWPPNGRFVPVTVVVQVADSGSGPAGFNLQSVTTSEGQTSTETRGFTLGTPDTAGELRAARFSNGPGRIYTLTYLAADVAGNTATCSATVIVPHDQEKKEKEKNEKEEKEKKEKDEKKRDEKK